MKTNKIFAVALAALTLVGFNACKPGQSEVEVESVTLDQKTLQIEVGATATLVATVAPEGAATVAWSSEDAKGFIKVTSTPLRAYYLAHPNER